MESTFWAKADYKDAWQRKFEKTILQMDAQSGLLAEQVTGINYHTSVSSGTVHRTRENAEFLPALYAQNTPRFDAMAEHVLRALLPLQDTNPESATYGVFPYLWEEPIENMKNPDWNWAPFMARVLITLLYEFEEKLEPKLRQAVKEAVRHACICICRRNMGVDYTNISLMSSFVLVSGGELLRQESYYQKGVDLLRRQLDFVQKNGGFAEYNSPYYGVIDIEETGRGLRYFVHEEALAAVRALHGACWEVFARHYHAPTRQIAPPHARCYADIQDLRIVSLLQIGLGDPVQLLAPARLEVDVLWPFVTLECPAAFVPCFAPLQTPRVVEEAFYKGFDPIRADEVRVLIEKDTPPMRSYTFLHPNFCLGSFAKHDLWNQRRPLMGYFATPAGIACFRVRCLHDAMDYSSAILQTVQHENAAAGAVTFVKDHGDYHYILTPLQNATIEANLFCVQFSLQGARQHTALRQTGTHSFVFSLPEQELYLEVPHVIFDGFTPSIEPYQKEDEVGVRVVLAQGDGVKIDFNRICAAAVLYHVEIVQKHTPRQTRACYDAPVLSLCGVDAVFGSVSVDEAVTNYMPPRQGEIKRFRNGGFYYEKT